MLHHRPGDGHTVKGGGAPADFVQNQQTFFGGVAKNVRHLCHFHHEGGLARRQIVAGADAGENPVHHADAGCGGGDEGPDLSQQHNQGHLTHIGGFARHVGAGNDGHPLLPLAHKRVVGDKQAVLQHPLHHGVAPPGNFNHAGLVHVGAAIAVPGGDACKGPQRVQLGCRCRGLLNAGGLSHDFFPQRGKKLIFQRGHPLGGGENLPLQVLQLLGDIPLAVCGGLLADVAFGDLVDHGLADLDVIAEHLVEANLQGPDAGFFLFTGLNVRKKALAPVHHAAKPVHLRVVSVPDKASLPDGKGRFVADGGGNQRPHVRKRVQQLQKLTKSPVGKRGQPRRDVRQLFNGCRRRHRFEYGASGKTAVDGGDGKQRPFQPAPQAPAPHGGFRFVQDPQKAATPLLAPHRLRQLQISAGAEVQLHKPALLVIVQPVNVAQVRFLGFVEIL